MKIRLLIVALATVASIAAPAAAQTRSEEDRWRVAQRRFDQEQRRYDQERQLYDRERSLYDQAVERSRRYNYRSDYDAADYYDDDPRYQERVLGPQDEVYRGSDGQYYCRRSDGTTGLIIGGGAGALLGNAIDGGRSRTAGTVVGGVLGALLGREVERNQIRCR